MNKQIVIDKARNLSKNFFVLFIGFVLAFILAEIIIRLFPNKFMQYLGDRSEISFKYKEDKELGYLCAPNQKALSSYSCFKIYPIHTNSLGFRGTEWDKKASFKIAILGDSHMLALGVSDGDYTAAILEKLLDKEVLNTGVGGYGTLQELYVYKNILRPLKPNLVILFFSIGDIADNSCVLSQLNYITRRTDSPCGYVSGGEIKFDTDFDKRRISNSRTNKFLKKYCLSCVVIHRFRNSFLRFQKFLAKTDLYTYMPAKTKEWQDAWKITEKILMDLKIETEGNGGKLIIVSIPEYIRISKTWKEEIKKEYGLNEIPRDFNTDYPIKKIQEIAQRYRILFLDLGTSFIEYRQKFNLKYPYLYYRCDGHWNPVGHFLASNIVTRYLVEKSLIPLEGIEKEKLLNKIAHNLYLSPLEILGKEAYDQIYKEGVYLGYSNIDKILRDN